MKCTACAEDFHCGMQDATPCWCAAEYPHALSVPAATQACFCPRCLAREIESRAANENQST
ncbi:MAG: cysteine-rich CWC family protein [Burkholderiales bacterium]